MKSILNDSDRELRSGAKILRVIVIIVIFTIFVSIIFNDTIIEEYIVSMCIIISVLFSVVIIEKKQLSYLNMIIDKSMFFKIVCGLILAALSNIIYYYGFGFLYGYECNRIFTCGIFLNMDILYWVLVGISEEILFRGYILSTLPKNMAYVFRNILVSTMFACLHFLNPDYISIWTFISAFLMSLFFGYVIKITGDLWITIAFHVLWNMIQEKIGIYSTGYRETVIILIVIVANLLIIYLSKALFYKKIEGFK